jgi:hypothetical protein
MFMGSDREITQDIITLDVVDTRQQDLFVFQMFDVAILVITHKSNRPNFG